MRTSPQNKGISTLSIVRTAAEVAQDKVVPAFGQYKGRLNWNEIAEINAQYVVWAYETIKNRQTCSLPLARACGYRDMSGKVPQTNQAGDEPEDEFISDNDTGFTDDDIPH